VGRLRKRTWISSRSGKIRAHHHAAAHHLPLHRIYFAGRTGGRHPQHLQQVFGSGVCPGFAECSHDRRHPVAGALFRSASAGAGLGGGAGWRAATGVDVAASAEGRHAAAPHSTFQRSWPAPDPQIDGARNAGRIGCANQPAHQYHLRVVSCHWKRILALLRRPSDGVSHRHARGGTGHHPPAKPGQTLCRRLPGRILQAAGLGTAADLVAGAAFRSWACR
jgi:hypothetical protein